MDIDFDMSFMEMVGDTSSDMGNTTDGQRKRSKPRPFKTLLFLLLLPAIIIMCIGMTIKGWEVAICASCLAFIVLVLILFPVMEKRWIEDRPHKNAVFSDYRYGMNKNVYNTSVIDTSQMGKYDLESQEMVFNTDVPMDIGDAHMFDSNTVDISIQSTGEYAVYIFMIDGKAVSYMTEEGSILRVPAGMHDIKILTRDSKRRVLYDSSINFDTDMSFTVKKVEDGYSVRRE